METWTPARVLINAELEALQLLKDYQQRDFSGVITKDLKVAIDRHAIKAAWEVERFLEGIYAGKLFFSQKPVHELACPCPPPMGWTLWPAPTPT